MCRKVIYLVSVVFVLGLVLTSAANAQEALVIWAFDEGSGNTAFDSSGNGHDGVIDRATWRAGGPDGKGFCLEFHDGATVIDEDAEDYLIGLEGLTVAVWIKADSIPTDKGFIICEPPDGGDNIITMRYDVAGATGGGTSLLKMAVVAPSDEQQLESSSNLQTTDWQHVCMTWSVGEQLKFYVNGVEDTPQANSGPRDVTTLDVTELIVGAGGKDSLGTAGWEGLIDQVQIYDFAMSAEQIQDLMKGIVAEFPKARGPSPPDGTLHEDTWITLSWTPGDYAVSHDVYLGENFDDVNDGTGDTFRGNQTDTFFIAGFPGFPYPDGLAPGTTYYWRIDEVNDANMASPWKGDVWSFSIPPKIAYNPNPAEGAKFIDLEAELSWTAGFGSKLHTVYFGDDFDVVNNATGGAPQGTTIFTPGTLELEKAYYWRVDEFDAITTHKGDVWTFTTMRAGGGVKGEYFNNTDLSGVPALTRIDPQINFYWNPGPNPPPGINEDNFSVRWTGELEAVFSEPVTFITGSDDGVRLYLDGELIIENWTIHDRTEDRSDPIELVADQTYSIVLEGYEGSGEAEWQLYWQSPSIPRQLIPQAAMSLPVKALSPNPPNGATGARMTATLSWKPGDNAASHQVYFGTDEDAVKNATTASPEYKGSKALGSESYDPGKLAWHTTYYWRVDEVNNVHPDSPWIGNLWSFTTGDFLVVDDFELYNDLDPDLLESNRIFLTWMDGYDTPINGSVVGYDVPPFCEQSIVHSGRQSMPLFYDNSGPAYYSEATLPLTYPRDWTEEGVGVLTLWFYGDPANVAESMYVAVSNATGPTAVVYHDNPDAALIEDWTEWNIDLEEFSNAGVSLTNVDSIAIGFGNRNNPQVGGSGMVFIDDIRLYRPPPPATSGGN